MLTPKSTVYIAAVKIAQKQAGLGDAEYRSLLQRVAGVRSAKELGEDAARRVLTELYRIRDRNDETGGGQPQQLRPKVERSPAECKLWALWYELVKLLPPSMQNADYLLGIVRRASGVHDLPSLYRIAKLTPQQIYKTIEALKLRLDQERKALASATGTNTDVPF